MKIKPSPGVVLHQPSEVTSAKEMDSALPYSHPRQCWADCPEHFPIDCKTFTVFKVGF